MRKLGMKVAIVAVSSILFIGSGGFGLTSVSAKNTTVYKEDYQLYDKDSKVLNLQDALNTLNEYEEKTLYEDLDKNGKSLGDIVSISKSIVYTKKDSETGEILPLDEADVEIIRGKVKNHQNEYEEKLTKSILQPSKSEIGKIIGDNKVSAYEDETYSGMTVTTWATDYSTVTYPVRYKLFGVFNWLWDNNPDESYTYNPSTDGFDFMTLNWAGSLTLETERYAEVNIKEYPWSADTNYNTNQSGQTLIQLADVELNGGLGYRFRESSSNFPYTSDASNGHMWVYVHKNTSQNTDANFKFTYSHTWSSTNVGYSIEAGYGTAAGSISFTNQSNLINFIVYDIYDL
ncbi:hypothetical protein ACX1C1_16990 [Paenibacillus sp. strain BS8-2]